MSWIYIVGVIIFAIVSNVKKTQKGNGKQKTSPRGAMPTFGGDGKDVFSKMRGYMQPEGERRSGKQGSGFPVPGEINPQTAKRSFSTYEETDYDATPAFSESALFPTPDYGTGEGLSLEQPGEARTDAGTMGMDQDFNRLYSTFDQVSVTDDGKRKNLPAANPLTSKQLQNGLIWAEILSPPRSKRPYNFRREG